MPSEVAKRVAGTYVADDVGSPPPVHLWALKQCRQGPLAPYIQRFCVEQVETLDPALVQIEKVTSERIQCRVPCRLYDHESAHPYTSEVHFLLNPATGAIERVG